MRNQRKGALKGLIIFLCGMAALTFFSRTIYYGTLPKVQVARVTSGVLQYEITGDAFLFDADRRIRVDVQTDLSTFPLRVSEVPVSERSLIKQGDVLVGFDPVAGADALEKAETACLRCEEALAAWDQRFLSAKQALTSETEVAAMERSRTVDGVSRTEKEDAMDEARAKRDALAALRASHWAVTAETDGLVGEVGVKPGDSYTGLLPLAFLIPHDASLRIGIETTSAVKIDYPESVTVYTGDAPLRGHETPWRFTGENVRGGKRVLWAEPGMGMAAIDGLTKLTFRVESEYFSTLVSSGAVVGDGVFVLDTRIGAFGLMESFARRVELRGLISDGQRTYVPAGISAMDQVIEKWDRPFNDGDTVILPLE